MKHPVLVPARADEVADGEDVLLIGSDGRVTTIRRQASGDGPDRVLARIAGQAAADAWARPGLYFRHSEALPIDMNLMPDRLLYRVRELETDDELRTRLLAAAHTRLPGLSTEGT